jgi:hypothetical protein
MSKDKVKGFLIGLGAGVLVAAFIDFGDESHARAIEQESAGAPVESGSERASAPADSGACAAQA